MEAIFRNRLNGLPGVYVKAVACVEAIYALRVVVDVVTGRICEGSIKEVQMGDCSEFFES